MLPDLSSGVVGEKGLNPIICKMWGLDGKKSDIEIGLGQKNMILFLKEVLDEGLTT